MPPGWRQRSKELEMTTELTNTTNSDRAIPLRSLSLAEPTDDLIDKLALVDLNDFEGDDRERLEAACLRIIREINQHNATLEFADYCIDAEEDAEEKEIKRRWEAAQAKHPDATKEDRLDLLMEEINKLEHVPPELTR
jgi:hypothetical protein